MTDGFLHVVGTAQDDGNRAITIMFADDKQDGFTMKPKVFKRPARRRISLRRSVWIQMGCCLNGCTNAASEHVSLPSRVIEIYFS